MATTDSDEGEMADSRGHRALDRAAARVRSIASASRSRLDAVRAERARQDLCADLGEVYYRSVIEGHGPDASEVDPIIDAISALGDTDTTTDEE